MTASHVWSALISIPVLQLFRLVILSLPYTRQGFFCADDEIRYPLYEDTIPSETMFTIFFFTALILVTAVEYTLIRHLSKTQRRMVAHDKIKGVHPGLLNIFFFMISLSCSTLATSVIINLGKRTANRLRPNFLAVCQPNLTELCPPNTFSYIEDYVCYGKNREDEYFSFPSGHAAHSVQFGVFMIYYLQKRCKFPQPLRSFIQFIIFLFVYFICLSRVHDHKHRLSDVAGGALIGLGTGTFFMCFVLRHFKSNRYRMVEVDMNESQALAKTLTPTSIMVVQADNNGTTKVGKLSSPSSEYGTLNAFSSSSCENIYEKISSSNAKINRKI